MPVCAVTNGISSQRQVDELSVTNRVKELEKDTLVRNELAQLKMTVF